MRELLSIAITPAKKGFVLDFSFMKPHLFDSGRYVAIREKEPPEYAADKETIIKRITEILNSL